MAFFLSLNLPTFMVQQRWQAAVAATSGQQQRNTPKLLFTKGHRAPAIMAADVEVF